MQLRNQLLSATVLSTGALAQMANNSTLVLAPLTDSMSNSSMASDMTSGSASVSSAATMDMTALSASSGVDSLSSLSSSSSTSSVPLSTCSIGTGATYTNQVQLDTLDGCGVIVGDLTVSGDVTSASLSDLVELDGDLVLYNATSLLSFTAPKLRKIDGKLSMQDLTVLATATFPELAEVDDIEMVALPAITDFAVNLGSVDNILISDTALEAIVGLGALQEINELNINNNRYLTSFNSSLKYVTESLQFTFNGMETAVKFDDLIWANNITLRDVDSASFANLQYVNASFGVINNTLTDLNLNQLVRVGQGFAVESNDGLTTVSADNLTFVGGGLVLANNTALTNINGFSKLETIGGALIVRGDFNNFTLPSLKSLRGSATLDTTSSNFTCDAFKHMQERGVIEGDVFVCKNGAVSISEDLSSGVAVSTAMTDEHGSTVSSTRTHKDAAVGLSVPATSFFGVVAAVIFGFL